MRKTDISNAQKKELELKMATDFKNGEKLNPKSAAKKYGIAIELSAMLLRNVKRRAQLAGEDMSIYIVNNGKDGDKKVNVIDDISVSKNEDEKEDDVMIMTNFTTTKKRNYTYNYNRMTDEVVNEMKEYLTENPDTSLKDLAEMVGFSISTVSTALKKAGLCVSNRRTRKKVEASKPAVIISETKSEPEKMEEEVTKENDFFKVANNRVYVGLCSERHPLPVTRFIFSSDEVDTHIGDFTYLNNVAEEFVKDLNSDDTLVLYCTGLQSLLCSVMSACAKYKISLVCMHHVPDKNRYQSQDVLNFTGNAVETPFDYFIKRGSDVYCKFDYRLGVPDKLFVLEKVLYSKEDKTIVKVSKFYFETIDEALKYYSELASHMFDVDELIGLFVCESNNFGDGAHVVNKEHQFAKAFNFQNDYQKA